MNSRKNHDMIELLLNRRSLVARKLIDPGPNEEELEVINYFDTLDNTCDENGLKFIKVHKHKIKTGSNFYEIKTQRKPFIVKQHFCYELSLGNCKICNNPIKFMNLHEHKSCTMSISDHKENSNY